MEVLADKSKCRRSLPAPGLLQGRSSFSQKEPTMFRSILVPLDGSKFAEQALPIASRLARSASATLPLAEVSHETVVGNEFGAVAVIETRPIETVRAYLPQVASQLPGPVARPPVTHPLKGPTVE